MVEAKGDGKACDYYIFKELFHKGMFKTSHDIGHPNSGVPGLASLPSRDMGPLCIIRSQTRNDAVADSLGVQCVAVDVGFLQENDSTKLNARVCFDKRGRAHGGIHAGENKQRNNVFMKPLEALEKFCADAGLKVLNGKARATPLPIERSQSKNDEKKKMNFLNIFEIHGLFEVKDVDKFRKSFSTGIGGRKSFGYGLIVIDESEETEGLSSF